MTTMQAKDELSYHEVRELAHAVWERLIPATSTMSAHEIRDREKFINERASEMVYHLGRLPSWALDVVANSHGIGTEREMTNALGAPPTMLLEEAAIA